MKSFSKQDEQRLLEAGKRYFATGFPNPERVGCPSQVTLRAIASRKLDREKAKEWDDHMSHCSPCFEEYTAFRQEIQRSARFRMVAAAAAVLIIGIATWLVWRSLGSRGTKPENDHRTNGSYEANLLDLREKSALRGTEPNTNWSPIELPRGALDLSIYLPTGSEPGKYEVEVVDRLDHPLVKSEGSAVLRDHIAVIEVKLNLESLHPGLYLVGIRQAGWSWTYYPVVLK